MIGIEINLRAVFRPGNIGIIIASAGQLLRRDFVITTARRIDDPDVLRMFGVEIAGAVGAIYRVRDHAYVALVWLFLLHFTRTRGRRGWWLLRCALLRQIFRIGPADEGDHLPIA